MQKVEMICNRIVNKNIDFEKLDFTMASDIANGSIGILKMMIYNKTEKKYRYEYYLCKIIKNFYTRRNGKYNNHFFKLEIMQRLNGTNKNVGDIVSRSGKDLYKNYYETKKANSYCRYAKHRNRSKLLLGI